jgi:hypothetical protein
VLTFARTALLSAFENSEFSNREVVNGGERFQRLQVVCFRRFLSQVAQLADQASSLASAFCCSCDNVQWSQISVSNDIADHRKRAAVSALADRMIQ